MDTNTLFYSPTFKVKKTNNVGCPKILYPLVHDIISPNGNGLINLNSIHINTNM